jgi:hypothetical protein
MLPIQLRQMDDENLSNDQQQQPSILFSSKLGQARDKITWDKKQEQNKSEKEGAWKQRTIKTKSIQEKRQ